MFIEPKESKSYDVSDAKFTIVLNEESSEKNRRSVSLNFRDILPPEEYPRYPDKIRKSIVLFSIVVSLLSYISCSRVYRLRFMYKICRFLSLKFQLPITFLLFGRFR